MLTTVLVPMTDSGRRMSTLGRRAASASRAQGGACKRDRADELFGQDAVFIRGARAGRGEAPGVDELIPAVDAQHDVSIDGIDDENVGRGRHSLRDGSKESVIGDR